MLLRTILALLLMVAPASAQFIFGGGSSGGGSGTVTTLSVATANGFAGTVATATTTPVITLTTSVTGNVCSNATALSACSTTGTGSTVLATSPTLATPVLGVATGTSLALNGVTLGTNSFAAAGTGLFNLNAAAAPAGATGTGVQLVGTDATVARFEADSFGAIGAFTVRRANGTGASPTALASSDQIGAFNFHGYYVTGGPGYSGVQATVSALATQNWTSTNQGTQILLRTTPNNSTTLTTAMTIGQDQSVAMAGTSTIATSLAIGGATIGTNALAVTGTMLLSGAFNGSDINAKGGGVIAAYNGVDRTLFFQSSGVRMASTVVATWTSSATDANSGIDTTLSRNAAGIIQFGTTAANAAGSWLATNGTLSGTLDTTGPARISHGYTVATLPAAGTAGRRAYVTDQLTTCAAIGVALTGGGAVVCPAFDNGVAWVGGYLLQRDLAPSSNDNSPAFMNRAA